MRWRRTIATVASLLGVAASPASAAWTDVSEAGNADATLQLLSLSTPALSCTPSGTSAVIGWTPSTEPTALNYSAQLVSPSSPLNVVNNAVTISPGLLDGLLGGLLGSTLTVRVTATLPGTGWTVTSERVVYYKLVLVVPTVSCTP